MTIHVNQWPFYVCKYQIESELFANKRIFMFVSKKITFVCILTYKIIFILNTVPEN